MNIIYDEKLKKWKEGVDLNDLKLDQEGDRFSGAVDEIKNFFIRNRFNKNEVHEVIDWFVKDLELINKK